jgi:hypothetical protein
MAGGNDSFALHRFGGMFPAMDDLLLPDGQAASSTNGYLFSGALEPWRKAKLLRETTLTSPGFVYRLPRKSDSVATATIYIASLPPEGAQLVLGEETYTFTATVNDPYSVKIGATRAACATNLHAAFTYDDGAGTNNGVLYGDGTLANPAIDEVADLATDDPRVTVYAPEAGAAYNTTNVSSTDASLVWKYGSNVTTTLLGGANISLETDITGDSTWLEFADPYTDVIRSPVVDDQFDRFYYASSSEPPKYNTRERIEAGEHPWLLGVPAPGCEPAVEVSGGGDTATIGFPTSITTATGNPGSNVLYLIPIRPAGAQILNDVTALAAGDFLTARFTAVLYDDLAGVPHTLLNVGTQVESIVTGQEVASLFTNPTGLLMNVQYWIGFMVDTAVEWQKANNTGSTGGVSLNTYSNGPPPIIQNFIAGFPELQVWGNLTTSSVLSARSYVYTYVSEYGEEGPPSPATVIDGWSNGTWTVGLFQPPPDQLGVTRNLKKIHLYRTVTAQTGATTYYFVAELDITTDVYTDIITDDVVVTNNQLLSQLWTPPPETLQGFVVLPNGILAGWKGNELWFSEPYRPHAWPPSYVLTTEYPIVGLGVSGNSVIAGTNGAPYIASGVSPGVMTATKVENSEPCHSRNSIIGNNDGVYYTSPNGLILVTQYGEVKNATERWITRERWQQLTPQSDVGAAFMNGQYYAWQMGGGDAGFTIELTPGDKTPAGLGFQLLDNELETGIVNVIVDPWSSVTMLLTDGEVNYLDFTDQEPELCVVDWSSKIFQRKYKQNFEAMRILFQVPPNTPTRNTTRLEADLDDPVWLEPLPEDRYGYILVYAANELVTAREIRQNQEILRITSDFKHESWQWRIITRLRIRTLQVGTSVKGLANV